MVIQIVINILGFIEKPLVWILLTYRWLRYGYAFRLIRMAQPRYAKVDPADYERLRKYEWIAVKACKKFYARRFVANSKTRKRKLIYMHREIIEVRKEMVVDHINNDGMDNRRINLREATHSQNICNRKKRSGTNTSEYIGVCWNKARRKWMSSIGHDKKNIHLGYFDSEVEAAKARDRAAKKYHGQFAYLNFPETPRGCGRNSL